MKLKNSLLFVLMFSFIILLFSGCGVKKDNTITDCSTGKVVTSFSSDEHSKERLMLLDADDDVEEKTIELNFEPKYLVHLADPNDSINDLYFYVYIKGNNIYVQKDINKMKELEDTFHLGLDNYIRKTNGITVDEFNSILAIK